MLGVFPEVFFRRFTLAILLTFLSSISFILLTTYNSSVVPGRWQSVMEIYYSFIFRIVCEIIGPKHGEKYFNSIFTLHLFVLWANLLALFPYTWRVTSQLAVTFTLAVLAFRVVNVIGFLHHGVHLLRLFCPKGAGLGLGSAIVIIEFVAYLIRVVSLGVRLFANIIGGHTLLKIVCVFIWFVFRIGGFIWIARSFALCLVFAINVLELIVAIIQAYVFSLLLTVYLGDVLDPAH
jgi:ATP synthase subunit 6